MNLSLALLAWALVAFGQPLHSSLLAALAGAGAYALFFHGLLPVERPARRFCYGTFWYGAVQLVQLYWMVSHPYLYIWAVYLPLCFVIGAQFGLLCLLITPARLRRWQTLVVVPAVWVLMEWLRLFWFSGFSWNPAGLALTAYAAPLQLVSWGGVFALSFWVLFSSMLLLRLLWLGFRPMASAVWLGAIALPYLVGGALLLERSAQRDAAPGPLWRLLLIQTAFPVEEAMGLASPQQFCRYVTDEWRHIVKLAAPHAGKQIDLAALPEFVVPYTTYSPVYRYDDAVEAFSAAFGAEAVALLPQPVAPYGAYYDGGAGPALYVNNAFWAQGLANCLGAPLVAGMEDADYDGSRRFYSAAMYFEPHATSGAAAPRYAKRVLVPMGEYIPFAFCEQLARSYGVTASFIPGEGPCLFRCGAVAFTPTICYEETFGALVAEGRRAGCDAIVNLTSDVWYPHSSLVWQHYHHARLRAVENGVPLIRCCNTGVTCTIDSTGTTTAMLRADDRDIEDLSEGLYAEVPLYQYATLYSRFGDRPIVILSWLALLLLIPRRKKSA